MILYMNILLYFKTNHELFTLDCIRPAIGCYRTAL